VSRATILRSSWPPGRQLAGGWAACLKVYQKILIRTPNWQRAVLSRPSQQSSIMHQIIQVTEITYKLSCFWTSPGSAGTPFQNIGTRAFLNIKCHFKLTETF
jgi:hypothetical protein